MPAARPTARFRPPLGRALRMAAWAVMVGAVATPGLGKVTHEKARADKAAAPAKPKHPAPRYFAGYVTGVDPARQVILLEPTTKVNPTEIVIVPGQSQVTHGGQPSSLADITPGMVVQFSYLVEDDRNVVKELSWIQPAPRPPPPPKKKGWFH